MGRMLSLWKYVPYTQTFVHFTIISLNFLHPEAQTLSPAFWIKTEHLSSRQESPEAWIFFYLFIFHLQNSSLFTLNYLYLLFFNLLLFGQMQCSLPGPTYVFYFFCEFFPKSPPSYNIFLLWKHLLGIWTFSNTSCLSLNTW